MNKDQNHHKIIRDIGFSFLSEGKILKVRADGFSMYPSIRQGAVIFIEPLAEGTDPVPGEIIAWKRESGFVVHRLIRILKTSDDIEYITRGDSSTYEDQPVRKDQIAGKVVRIDQGKERIETEQELIRKPAYFYNRLILWILLRTKKVLNILLTSKRSRQS